MRNAEGHLELLLGAFVVTKELINLLPQTDLVDVLDTINIIQFEIISRFIVGSGFTKAELSDLEADLRIIIDEINSLKSHSNKSINGVTYTHGVN